MWPKARGVRSPHMLTQPLPSMNPSP
jgi:hypothetical protein